MNGCSALILHSSFLHPFILHSSIPSLTSSPALCWASRSCSLRLRIKERVHRVHGAAALVIFRLFLNFAFFYTNKLELGNCLSHLKGTHTQMMDFLWADYWKYECILFPHCLQLLGKPYNTKWIIFLYVITWPNLFPSWSTYNMSTGLERRSLWLVYSQGNCVFIAIIKVAFPPHFPNGCRWPVVLLPRTY